MVRIIKGEQPKVLADNADKWKKEYLSCIDAGKKPSKRLASAYNHPTIKKALEDETHGKCAYCESKITHIDHGDIEHILPKNKNARPDLCYEWSNLTLACTKCNQSGKGDYYNKECLLINPYNDDPDVHFVPFGSLVLPFAGDERAEVTENRLGLNRERLLERRKERIDMLMALLKMWKTTAPSSPMKSIIEGQLHNEYDNSKEFSFTVRGLLAAQKFPVKNVMSCTYTHKPHPKGQPK